MEKSHELPLKNTEKLIVVTGFGIFHGHEKLNASFEAVRLLPDNLYSDGQSYRLDKLMVPVEYAAVDKIVDMAWQQKPELVIHCGVHNHAKCVHVEKQAYNHRFKRADYSGKFLLDGSASLKNFTPNDDIIATRLNVERIAAAITQVCDVTTVDSDKTPMEIEGDFALVKSSYDVGNYLCGYMYLKSLDEDRDRTLFVHVPPIDKPFTSAQTKDILIDIIKECLKQITEHQRTY